jgi:hypothetical protein
MNFEDYLDNLKKESERGAVPNDDVPIERFIQVADNIMSKVDESMPKESMNCDTNMKMYAPL